MAKMRFIQAIKIAPNPKSEKIMENVKFFWLVVFIPQIIPERNEIIIDRDADYNNIDPYSMAADNAWCGGIVLGNPIENWLDINFENLRSILHWNNEKPENAKIMDSNPFESLAWVVNLKLSQNIVIPKGSKIITGSVIKTRSPRIGDKIIYEIPNLSTVEIRVN